MINLNILNIANNIARLRHDKKITQEQLAEFIGVTKASVSKWENNQSTPDITILPQPAAFFDVTIDELIGYTPQEVLDILSSVKEHTTVIFSTHILADVERICDRIAFLNEGKIALSGTLEEIRKIRNGESMEPEFLTEQDMDRFWNLYAGGEKTGRTKMLFSKKTERDMLEMMECLSQNQIPIVRLERLEPTLEDLFLEVIGK